jgi:transposase
VIATWRCFQRLRSAFTAESLAENKKIALAAVESFSSCPIPEISRLGRTLRVWKEPFLAYFTTGRASNGGTEASTASSNSIDASLVASATHPTID